MKPAILLALLPACLASEPDDLVSGPEPDPSPPALEDVLPGLRLGDACVPTLDECQANLTCLLRGAHAGFCSAPGPVPAGGACEAFPDCGRRMACVQDELGQGRCRVVCDSLAPEGRCSSLERCVPVWGETGVCLP